jgi:multiple sugar transport system ATP-binding protein
MAGITLEAVGKIYDGDTRAVANVDIEVADGEFVVLVGPSGCGKSTLLRMVAGLEEITEGKISIGDRVVNDVAPKDRDIAMVFQNYALYPHMSVFDNMAFGLKMRKMPRAEIKERVEDAARVLDITDLLDRKSRALSGGQMQRVAMGRAIVREPAAFLMDEPLSNLDAKLRVQMRSELGLIHARLKTTTLYVTHDQVEAMTMGDRVAVLQNASGTESNLQQIDTPRNLYDSPRNLFVAGFIGSPAMNFVYGTVSPAGSDAVLAIGTERLHVDGSALQAKPGLSEHFDEELVVGIRPEAFEGRAAAVGGNVQGRIMRATVGLVEQLGPEAYVHFTKAVPPVVTADIAELLADEGQDVASLGQETKFLAKVHPDMDPKVGQNTELVIDTTKLHFFDPATGAAIS